MGNCTFIAQCSPLGCVFQIWGTFTYKPMKRKGMIFLCRVAGPQYAFDSGKQWPEDGSLNYTPISQTELFCRREEKWEEVPYIQVSIYYIRKDHFKETVKFWCKNGKTD